MNGPLRPDRTRARALDQVRGAAVAAMIAYHFAWDLSHFGLIDADVPVDPVWKLFAQTIAATFLVVAGISLHLSMAERPDMTAFWRRFGRIAGAAALVTTATYFAFPQSYIVFGILHCIAASSVLALAFRNLPAPVTALVGLAMILLPVLFRARIFDAGWLVWIGLGENPPRANDYVPMVPWAGLVLLGLATGRTIGARLSRAQSVRRGDLFVWAGQHSLAIYLLHQPVLYGALMLAIHSGILPDRRAEQSVTRTCAVECQASGASPSICAAACQCATEALRDLPLWSRVLGDALTVEDRAATDAIGRNCYRDALGRVPARKP